VLRDVADGIGAITLNRPEQMNALTVALSGELEQAILELGSNPGVNVVVIQGAGGNFCAGGDFNEVELLRSSGPDALRALFAAFRRACDAIASVEVPVVAAVEGVAMAGGFELMQASDIVLVSDDAKIADNHIKYGMIPSGDRISGVDAVRRGLAYRSFPQAEFSSGVHRFVTDLAGRRREAVICIKRLVYTGIEAALPTGLEHEIDCVVDHICGHDGQHGVTAFRQRGAG